MQTMHANLVILSGKDEVAQYNLEKLYALDSPVAQINSSPVAASTSPDDANGLYPAIFLTTKAQVMLIANLWPEVGLCNGAPGTVYQLLFYEGQAPPNLPVAVRPGGLHQLQWTTILEQSPQVSYHHYLQNGPPQESTYHASNCLLSHHYPQELGTNP